MIHYQKSIRIITWKEVSTLENYFLDGTTRCVNKRHCSSIPVRWSVFYVLPISWFCTLGRKKMWAFIKKRFLFNTMPPNAVSLLLTLLLQFRCCGVTNHTDWFEVYNATRVPDSCCLEYSDNCGLDNPGTWWTAVSFGRNKVNLSKALLILVSVVYSSFVVSYLEEYVFHFCETLITQHQIL